MNINIEWVWDGILGWAALTMLALAFVHGANRNVSKDGDCDHF